ncbi:MAG: spore germination protein [Clostridia bacterium]|nr:spore germination protein [Clostridia bacterium]
MTGRNSVTSSQMALFTFVTQTGIGVVTLPTVMAKEVGHDGWISVLLSGFIAVILSALFAVLLKRYSDKGIFDINKLIFGKVLGTVLNVLLVIYLILAAVRGVRVFTLFLRLTVLPLSPPVAISPFILLPSIYLVWQGLKYVCRFKYISVISYVIAILFMALMASDLKTSFLMPVGEAGLNSILSSIPSSFLAFIGLELIVFLFPEIIDKKKAFKWHVSANILSTIFLILVVGVCTALFGEKFLQIQIIPLFNMARAYNAPILERIDLYMISLWFVVMGCSMRAYMFAAYYSLQKVFNMKNTRLSLALYFVSLVLLSRIPRDINEAFMFLEITNYTGIGVSLFFVICLCISFIRKKGVKTR